MGVANAIPSQWRSVIKENGYISPPPLNEKSYFLKIEDEMVDILSTYSKTVYKEFFSYRTASPTAQAKLENKYPSLLGEWTKIYTLPFNVTLDTKLKAFQYKFLNRIIHTNEKLFSFKIADSPYCTFCKNEVESTEHFFFFCNEVDMFWKEVLSRIAIYSNLDVFFGKFDIDKDLTVINHISLLGKFFIYSRVRN